jgi:hypothetical protein
VDVSDPNIEEAAHPVGIAGRLQNHLRLVVGWASTDINDDPTVLRCDIRKPPWAEESDLASEYLGVEVSRALDVIRDDEVGQYKSLWALRARPSATSTGCIDRPLATGSAVDVMMRTDLV